MKKNRATAYTLTADTLVWVNTTRRIKSIKTRIVRRASTIQNIALMTTIISTQKKTRNTSHTRNIAMPVLMKRLLISRLQNA